MAKVKFAVASRHRRKTLLKKAKGYYGARSKQLRRAKETVMRALAYATRDRKNRKREFRSLWIIRLNAAARERGSTYGRLIAGLRKAKITIDRKQLSELALHDVAAFNRLMSTALGTEITTPEPASAAPKKPAKARPAKKAAAASA